MPGARPPQWHWKITKKSRVRVLEQVGDGLRDGMNGPEWHSVFGTGWDEGCIRSADLGCPRVFFFLML